MRYGYFDDEQREYVITRPDTPLPWMNYLGCDDYFGIISNTAGGYSFYKDARLRRLTRYRYNNVPLGYRRTVYLPARSRQRRDTGRRPGSRCRQPAAGVYLPAWHGLHRSIGSSRQGIRRETRYFVPLGENLEIWQVTLTNQRAIRQLICRCSRSVEFCLWDAWDDATNFQRNFQHRRS